MCLHIHTYIYIYSNGYWGMNNVRSDSLGGGGVVIGCELVSFACLCYPNNFCQFFYYSLNLLGYHIPEILYTI